MERTQSTDEAILTDITRVGVLAHPLRPQTFPVAEEVAVNLEAVGIKTWVFTQWESGDVQASIPESNIVVAIGGDGAMLRASRVCAPHRVPVLGINMGQLGFLTEISDPENWQSAIEPLLSGAWWSEQRMMLNVSVVREERVIFSEYALNDAVISGSIFGRMLELQTEIDGDWTTTYYADALVIATATGSTAYALACGGPILPPELNNILIVPAAPHLSLERPIVLPEGAVVQVKPLSVHRAEMVVTADGNVMCKLESGDIVRIQGSEYVSQFVRLRGRNYFYRSLLDRLEPLVRRGDHRRGDG